MNKPVSTDFVVKKNRKRRYIWIVATFLLLVLASVIYFKDIWQKVEAVIQEAYEPIDEIDSVKVNVKTENKEPLNLLLLGIDEREGDQGRPDTMILARLNPDTKETTLMSIPRDTLVTLPGKNIETKMNHSYTYGGLPLTVATVEDLFTIDIDYYLKVNMEAFEKILSQIGSVKVNSQFAFSYNGFSFDEGEISVSPEEALSFVRMRKDDPMGDNGRNYRQRQIVSGMAKELIKSSPSDIIKILESVSPYIKTNVRSTQLFELLVTYSSTVTNMNSMQLNGEDQLIDGKWYFILNETEPERVQSLFGGVNRIHGSVVGKALEMGPLNLQ